MNKGLVIGLGALGLLLLASSTAATPQPPAPPPPPPPPPPTPEEMKEQAAKEAEKAPFNPGDPGWLRWPPGTPEFLKWSPGKDEPEAAPEPEAPVLAQAGERWEIVFDLSRRLGFLEVGMAKNAFAVEMPDQRLDTMVQSDSPPPQVILTTTYTREALAPWSVGQIIEKSGITAKLISAKRIA